MTYSSENVKVWQLVTEDIFIPCINTVYG